MLSVNVFCQVGMECILTCAVVYLYIVDDRRYSYVLSYTTYWYTIDHGIYKNDQRQSVS